MPNTTLRKSVIQQLRERVDDNYRDAENLINLLTETNKISELDERNKSIHVDTEELGKLLNEAIIDDPAYKKLEELEQQRYLVPRDEYKKRSKDRDAALEDDYIQKKSEVDFRRCIRMSKKGFLALYEEIKDDEAFKKPRAGPRQRSVKLQMLVALTRLGIYGNAATDKILGDQFGISHGSVYNYVANFIQAVLRLQQTYIQWPMGKERERVIQRHHELFGLPECVGFMDGSLFKIYQTPSYNPQLFWSRKNKPAIQNMLICDFDTRILFGTTGHYGSQNDPGVLNDSGLLELLYSYFEGEQYVIADSAYGKTKWCVPVGKSSQHEPLTGSDIKFNSILSRARVSIENCFGALKGRFGSLDELRNQLKEEADIDRYNRWIAACFILHNFCLKHDDPSFMAQIIDYFYRTHDRNDYFETSANEFSKTKRNSKYGNYGTVSKAFVVPNISTSAGIEKWLTLKEYSLDINHCSIEDLDAKYEANLT